MRLHDVDLPQVVIDAQRRGELVVFAGAGVSMDAPSNYPDFLGLAKELGGIAYPKGEKEAVDRYLGRLEEHGIAVHDRVKTRLSDPLSRPNHLHEAIIRLFGSTSAIRIVTTNFDDHFRAAALSVFGESPAVYRAPALPLGHDFKGIVHLHGSVFDESERLVLTDADFGRAYLTQGWARRFVQQLFSKFVVLFVGYSHQDLPLLYLARGISAAEGGPGRYALTDPTRDTDWLNLGITPVNYPLHNGSGNAHEALGGCLARWAENANLGSLGTEAKIKGIVTSDRPASIEDEDFLKQSLLHISTLRYFTRHAKDPRWLEWVAEFDVFRAIFSTGAILSESSATLSNWFAEEFAERHFALAIDLVRRNGQTLSPSLWIEIALAFHRQRTAGDPLRFWAPILLETMPANADSDLLAYMIDHCNVPEDQQTILQLLRKLSTPRLELKRSFFTRENGKPSFPDVDVVPVGQQYWMCHAYRTKVQPHLDDFAKGVARIVTEAFEQAHDLLLIYRKAASQWDHISSSRGSVASHTQDHLHNGFSVLIDAGVDVLTWANEHNPKFASRLIGQWIESEALILKRLAINGMAGHPLLNPDGKLEWAISNHIVENFGLKNETFALLSEVYGACSEEMRAELLAQAESAMNPPDADSERYEFFKLLSWLHARAPECKLVKEKLEPIHERNPNWTVLEHPDFNSWIGGIARQAMPESPVPSSQIEEMNLNALLLEISRLAGEKDNFGDSRKVGFLQEIARTAAANFRWSEKIAREALESGEFPIEVWSALLRGWSTNHTPEAWKTILAILEPLEPVYDSLLDELSALLKSAVDRVEGGVPLDQFETALARANSVWSVCAAHEQPLPQEDDNWVTVAINRTSGYLLEFYFEALRLLWPDRSQQEALIQGILLSLESAIGDEKPASEVARVLVSGKAALLADISPDWYEKFVLPLLAAPKTPRFSEQNWDGYLVWGTWTQTMLAGLISAFMGHLMEITTASDERSRMFCDHLAGFAVFGSIDPIQSGWLDEFLTRSGQRERIHCVRCVTQILRDADDQAKESAWNRWLKGYIGRRVQAIPIPLDAAESGLICEWALILTSHYAEIVELILAGPAPDVRGAMFYYRLHEADLMDQAPEVTARLLKALLSQDDGHKLWDLEQVHLMVSHLIDRDPTAPELRPLCERLGTLGSPRALEFQERLK